MADVPGPPPPGSRIREYDAIYERVSAQVTSFTEAEALGELWALGEDGWLREDDRFRRTPWGRWIPSDRYLINDLVVGRLREDGVSELSLAEELAAIGGVFKRTTAVCTADPRLRIEGDRVRLGASELSGEPLLEDAGPLLQYATHLPVVSLKAIAASEPAGEWGPRAEPQQVEALGWLRVEGLERPLNRRMFVARVRGESMDGGGRPIGDGAWAVFEFSFYEGDAYDAGAARPIVLVRGELADPETGAYAVKRWEREAVDEIRLVSANPDRARFPDIVVPLDEADQLRIIATFAQVLSPSEFARRPKVRRTPGRRALEGAGGAQVGEQLGRRLAAFFEGTPGDDAEGEEAQEATGWSSRLVCLEGESGGLHLEIGPLTGLPPFVKRLRAVGEGWDAVVLAANARQRPTRVAAPPGSGPWRWEAVGFEDEEDLELGRLDQAALSDVRVAVFRVDAAGIGQAIAGTALSAGQVYRLVVPPGLAAAVAEITGVTLVSGGWRLWEVDLAEAPSESMRDALEALRLTVGEAQPRLGWTVVGPDAWRTTPRGEAYAVFATGRGPVVRAQGLPGAEDEPAVLFLRGEAASERLVLPAGDEAVVALGALAPGRWACRVLHPRVEIQPSTLLFEVAEAPTPQVSADWRVTVGGEVVEDEGARERNLSGLAQDDPAVEVEAPPGWPVRVSWRVMAEAPVRTAHADAAGVVDLRTALAVVGERARRARVADLVLDLGELGLVTVPHGGQPSVEDLRTELKTLVTQRAGLVRSQPGAWQTLKPLWFEPVARLLGYTLGEAALGSEEAGELGLAAWPLVIDERGDGQVQRETVRVLVLTTDVEAAVAQAQPWLDAACGEAGVREAILSDGLRWTTHRKRSSLARPTWAVDAVVDTAELETMLAALAEGM